MAKKTNPPKKTTSPVGPYKTAPKGDKSTGVRKMVAEKPKGGSQFLPKGVSAGKSGKTTPARNFGLTQDQANKLSKTNKMVKELPKPGKPVKTTTYHIGNRKVTKAEFEAYKKK